MVNFRVRNLDAMVAQLRRAGIEVDVDPKTYPNGRFARLPIRKAIPFSCGSRKRTNEAVLMHRSCSASRSVWPSHGPLRGSRAWPRPSCRRRPMPRARRFPAGRCSRSRRPSSTSRSWGNESAHAVRSSALRLQPPPVSSSRRAIRRAGGGSQSGPRCFLRANDYIPGPNIPSPSPTRGFLGLDDIPPGGHLRSSPPIPRARSATLACSRRSTTTTACRTKRQAPSSTRCRSGPSGRPSRASPIRSTPRPSTIRITTASSCPRCPTRNRRPRRF